VSLNLFYLEIKTFKSRYFIHSLSFCRVSWSNHFCFEAKPILLCAVQIVMTNTGSGLVQSDAYRRSAFHHICTSHFDMKCYMYTLHTN